MNRILTILLLLIPSSLFSQVDYSKIKREPFYSTLIDTLTERVIIVDKKYATVVFRQEDVINQISSNQDSELNRLIEQGSQKIFLKDWWFSYTDDDRNRLFRDADYRNSDYEYVKELNFIGPDIIFNGNTMIIDRSTGEVVQKKMRIIRVDDPLGTRTVQFRLPNKKSFWEVLLRLGE